jgi:hypothetical protein
MSFQCSISHGLFGSGLSAPSDDIKTADLLEDDEPISFLFFARYRNKGGLVRIWRGKTHKDNYDHAYECERQYVCEKNGLAKKNCRTPG